MTISLHKNIMKNNYLFQTEVSQPFTMKWYLPEGNYIYKEVEEGTLVYGVEQNGVFIITDVCLYKHLFYMCELWTTKLTAIQSIAKKFGHSYKSPTKQYVNGQYQYMNETALGCIISNVDYEILTLTPCYPSPDTYLIAETNKYAVVSTLKTSQMLNKEFNGISCKKQFCCVYSNTFNSWVPIVAV